MATNSLHLTTMSLQYPPTVVACVCIHLACKWSDWELPASNEGKEWYWYVDQTVTKPLLEELTTEFLVILEKAPSRLKRKLSGGGKESEIREKRKLEVSLASPGSGIRSHEKESQPCEKRVKTENPATSSSSVGSSSEKAHIHQEDKRLVTANRHHKSVPSPVASSKEIQPHHSKSSAVHNMPAPSLVKLPISTTEEPSPSKRFKEGSHSITIADYKEMKEKQEQKIKGQNKISNYNPQSHLVPPSSKKPIKEERKPDFHQNTNERSRPKHHKTSHPKHTEDNIVTNEQQPAELTNTIEENLQQKAVDDVRHNTSSRAVNSNRAETTLGSTWYDKGKSESYHLKQKELPVEMPVHPLSHQAKNSARPLAQETLVSQHTEQDTRIRHGSELPSEHAQTNMGNGENISQTKATKTKHQKHKVVPPIMPTSLPQDELPGHDRNAKKIAESENLSNPRSTDIAIAHKSESEHFKRIDSSVDKVGDFTPRQDRREKHKHKHSSHSSEREKTSNSAEHGSSSSISGGLKITIPKEKIVSSTQRTNSSNSPRETLKIKINKGKIASNETSKSSSSANRNLKLVIAKDKKQRNSYSCTSYAYSPQKPDCDGQKREKSPTSGSAGTSSEPLNVNRSPKVKYEHALSARRSTAAHSSNDEMQIPLPPEINPVQHTNIISHNPQIMTSSMPMGSYHQPKPPHQGYVAYNQPQYFPQYFQCPPVHMNANTTRLPQLFNNPRIPPPFLSDEPPLPKEPPPLPPPLPPE